IPVSAVAVPSFSLMTDCADNLIDSSQSSASHQFQEIFPPLADIDIGRVRRRQRGVRRQTRRAVLTAAPADYDSSANGGNIGVELLLSAGSELVAASAEFCLCANCGLCCQGADRMRAHKTASGHLGFLSARISWNPAQAVLRHVALHGHERYQKKRPKMTARRLRVRLWRQRRGRHPGPFDCAVCGRAPHRGVGPDSARPPRPAIRSSKPSAVSAEARKALPAQSKPAGAAAAVGSSRPSPVVTLGPSERRLSTVQHRSGRQRRADLLQVSAVPPANEHAWTGGQPHQARFSRTENFASLVDDRSRLADGRRPGQELPYLRVRLCPMRPGRVTTGFLLIVALAEESAQRYGQPQPATGLVPADQSVYLTLPALPYSAPIPHSDRAARISTRRIAGRVPLWPRRPSCCRTVSASMRRGICQDCVHHPLLHLCDRCFPRRSPSSAPASRHATIRTQRCRPPVKRRRPRSIVDFGAARRQTRADTGDDRLLLCFTCGGELHQL
uniref:C2H2-type domain-containing protein n=1 Tax=Macrostomum lignano TaxID=282301 RepID=A0A1I8JNW8_9PLAT